MDEERKPDIYIVKKQPPIQLDVEFIIAAVKGAGYISGVAITLAVMAFVGKWLCLPSAVCLTG